MAWRNPLRLCVGKNGGGRAKERDSPYQQYDIGDESLQRRKKRACSVPTDEEGDAGSSELNIVGSFCGRESIYSRAFSFLFPNRSYPMDASNCVQIDTTHWVLDMSVFVGEDYSQVKEICVFLASEVVFPPGKALAVYAQSPGSQFQYCGAVDIRCPSAVLSLLWPSVGGGGGHNATLPTAKVGICVEDLVSLPNLDMGKQKRAEDLAMKVGENLLSFMQSFCSVETNKLAMPIDILDRWFKRFQERTKRDPAYLNGFAV